MKKLRFPRTGDVAFAGVVAALYIILTLLSRMLGLDSGVIQLRFSEALTVLPYFLPSCVPGLFIGCLLSNLLAGCALPDILFGSLTTLAAAAVTAWIGKRGAPRVLAPLPPILFNAVTVPCLLSFVYGAAGTFPVFLLTVTIGELLSCGVMGLLLARILQPVFPKLQKRFAASDGTSATPEEPLS